MINRFENWDLYLDPRIEQLKKNSFHLEAFYLYSATIEHCLQDAVILQEELLDRLAKRSGLKYKQSGEKTIREKTLGEVIKYFSKYDDDPALVSRLNAFNSLRKKVVHKLLDNSLEQLDKEVKSKYREYSDLVRDLCKYNVRLLDKTLRMHNRDISKLKKQVLPKNRTSIEEKSS